MNNRPYNPDDLAFLISQGLDGDLSAEQRRRLDEALRASAELRREARGCRRRGRPVPRPREAEARGQGRGRGG